MINELKSNLDCITDTVTFLFVFVKVVLFLAGFPNRLLEGIMKKDIGNIPMSFFVILKE
ncbi:hypothetical protein [Staphylococcus xylosus]|uniref:hypothetical protein n=1 Tax=Staphylococcus xylosus TaxID=1288 RepID=UPI003F5611C8